MSTVAPLKGVVLAGGRSRRLGTDKAAVDLAGSSLLDRAVTTSGLVVGEVVVAVAADQLSEPLRARYNLLADRFSNAGPAAGIFAAHEYDPHAAWLVLACDMPLVDAAVIRMLTDARDPAVDATVVCVEQEVEPLCAIYEPSTLANFLARVEAGGNTSPRAWLRDCRLKRVQAGPELLISVNTGADLEIVRRELETSDPGSGGEK